MPLRTHKVADDIVLVSMGLFKVCLNFLEISAAFTTSPLIVLVRLETPTLLNQRRYSSPMGVCAFSSHAATARAAVVSVEKCDK